MIKMLPASKWDKKDKAILKGKTSADLEQRSVLGQHRSQPHPQAESREQTVAK